MTKDVQIPGTWVKLRKGEPGLIIKACGDGLWEVELYAMSQHALLHADELSTMTQLDLFDR